MRIDQLFTEMEVNILGFSPTLRGMYSKETSPNTDVVYLQKFGMSSPPSVKNSISLAVFKGPLHYLVAFQYALVVRATA